MNYPHRIRLRGPWECVPLVGDDPDKTLPQERTVRMPGSLREQGLAGFVGDVLLRRRFGYPGRIDSWERVWLTFDDIRGLADIRLNGAALAGQQSGRLARDVTELLGERNHLEVHLEAAHDGDGLTGEVALEVRALAYLDRIASRRMDDKVEVSGVIAGQCADDLDLYALVDRRNAQFQSVRAGQAFAFQVEANKGQTLRVELVWRSQVWYAVERIVDD